MSSIPNAMLVPLRSDALRPATPAIRWRPSWHPFLLAIFPVLTIWAGNIREVTVAEAAVTSLALVAIAAAVWLVLRPLFHTDKRASLAATWLLLGVFCFGFTEPLRTGLLNLGGAAWLARGGQVAVWFCVLAAGLWWLRRKSLDEDRLNQLAGTFAVGLLGMSGLMLAAAVGMSPWIFSGGDNSLSPPAAEFALTVNDDSPDIYYLVFDRYGGEQTLREQFGHDNRPFIDDLKSRGFAVAGRSHANYPKTELSMASALNLRYHEDRIWPKSRYRPLLQDHLAGRLLTQAGYRYYHFGNKHTGLRANRNADINYRFSAMPTELAENVFRMTPAYAAWPTRTPAEQALDKFAGVAEIAKSPGRKFVYAHFMLPHEPWKFDEDGSLLPAKLAAERSERENYARQLRYTNRCILELIDAIEANSQRPPIIVIQADEGPELRYEGDADLSETAKLKKRCEIISAFRLPGRDSQSLVHDTISPVNTFRLVFREYFAAELELLDDRYFYWNLVDPMGKPDLTNECRFVDVTDLLLAK